MKLSLEVFLAKHPNAEKVDPGTTVTIEHKAYTVFGSGGAWSELDTSGSPVFATHNMGHNGFIGRHQSQVTLKAGEAVYGAHGDGIGDGRCFFSKAFYAA